MLLENEHKRRQDTVCFKLRRTARQASESADWREIAAFTVALVCMLHSLGALARAIADCIVLPGLGLR